MAEAPALLMVTGWRGAGKTTLCRRLAALERAGGRQAAGLVCPARFAGGEKTGILAEDLRSGEQRLLASRLAGELHGPRLGPWTFDAAVFEWGSRVLGAALPCDLLVIDEIGPLEFDLGQGFREALPILAGEAGKPAYRLAVVVVRPEYNAHFLRRWPTAGCVTVAPGQEALAEQQAAAFLAAHGAARHLV